MFVTLFYMLQCKMKTNRGYAISRHGLLCGNRWQHGLLCGNRSRQMMCMIAVKACFTYNSPLFFDRLSISAEQIKDEEYDFSWETIYSCSFICPEYIRSIHGSV